jgi:PST family polysaccharide transporter
VAIGYVISTYLVLHPTLVYAFRDTPIRPSDFYRSILKPTVASLSMAAVLVFIEGRFTGLGDAALLVLMVPAGALIYLGVFALLPKGRQEIAGYLGYVKILWHGALKAFSRIRGRS